MLGSHPKDGVFILRFAGFEGHEADALSGDLARHFRQNIDALLPREPGNHADERAIHGIRREAEFLEQLALASLFPAKIVGGVAGGDERIGFRVPLAAVDAVEDAGKHIGASAQSPIQTEAALGCLDFAGIGGTDGRERIREFDAALDVVDAAEEFHAAGTVDAGVQPHLGERGLGKKALVTQVVDGEQGLDARKVGSEAKVERR